MLKTLRKIWKIAIVENKKHKNVENFIKTLHEKKTEPTDESIFKVS